MNTLSLTIYALIWPLIVLVVMLVIGRSFFAEWRVARREGKDLI